MPFRLAIFNGAALSDDTETRRALHFLKGCEVLNMAVCTTESAVENSRKLMTEGHLEESWFCPNDEEEMIRYILARHKIAARDALYVGRTPPSIGRANKTGVTTFFLGEYPSPPYIHQTKPCYQIPELKQVVAVVRAQLGA
jgi:hypothetical protein